MKLICATLLLAAIANAAPTNDYEDQYSSKPVQDAYNDRQARLDSVYVSAVQAASSNSYVQPKPQASRPVQYSAPSKPAQVSYKDEPSYPAIPAKYNYDFEVKDDTGYATYSKNENRDGDSLTGSYTVKLPDSRTQIVTYRADPEKGFVADVRYEGEAVYPEEKPKPAVSSKVNEQYDVPAYRPAPAPAPRPKTNYKAPESYSSQEADDNSSRSYSYPY